MPRNKYPEETVQKILEVSLKLFLEKGYENTTILDIVDNLGGLTRGAFYHHFKSKEELMDVLTDKLFEQNNPFEKVKKDTSLNGLQKLQQIMKDSTEETTYRALNVEAIHIMDNPRFLADFIKSNRDIVAPSYQELIEEGIADGSIQNEYPKQSAEILTFLTNFWMLPNLYPFTAEEGIARIRMIRDITVSLGIPMLDEEIMKKMEQGLQDFAE